MRVVDLDRDMSDVIPTSMSRDSEYLFERMTLETIDAALPDLANASLMWPVVLARTLSRWRCVEPTRWGPNLRSV
jgi:hypothetical protein